LLEIKGYEVFRVDNESAFIEWENGYSSINPGIAAFLESPGHFENNPEDFRFSLSIAATKFEILSKTEARDLRETHEHIALVEGQEKAEKVTGVPVSALKRLEDLDTALEIGRKWIGRAVQYAPWVIEIAKRL
jgi:hypothetical protein